MRPRYADPLACMAAGSRTTFFSCSSASLVAVSVHSFTATPCAFALSVIRMGITLSSISFGDRRTGSMNFAASPITGAAHTGPASRSR